MIDISSGINEPLSESEEDDLSKNLVSLSPDIGLAFIVGYLFA